MATNRQFPAILAYLAIGVFLVAVKASQDAGYENGSVAVLAASEIAYPYGSDRNFGDGFEPTWGRFPDRILPVPGNYENRSDGALPKAP